jgi:putative hemolysin
VILLLLGIALSAFFSGSETGFYRVTRVRLLLDALTGDWISRGLLMLTHRPGLFVATTLIGNNLANYLTSLAIVLMTKQAFQDDANLAELAATVLFSPVVFVYGELLPKYLFLNAPNRLLRQSGPLFLVFTILFLPLACLLWSLGRALQSLVGETPLRARSVLARKEVEDVLQEGQEAGILQPMQQRLAQNLLSVAGRPISQFCIPASRIASASPETSRTRLLDLARRHGANVLLIQNAGRRGFAGYVRTIELSLCQESDPLPTHDLLRLDPSLPVIDALIELQSLEQDLAEVVDASGKPVGLLLADELANVLIPTTR